MKRLSRSAALAALAVVAAMTCSCAKKAVKKTVPSEAPAASGLLPEPDIRGALFQGSPELAPVHFDYDSRFPGKDAREALIKNAETLKRHPGWEALVEGHCDERGTVEYNLALGQDRAKAVREYYLRLGVPGGRVATISFGEERPACIEPDEPCRKKNRRAETKVRLDLAASENPPSGRKAP